MTLPRQFEIVPESEDARPYAPEPVTFVGGLGIPTATTQHKGIVNRASAVPDLSEDAEWEDVIGAFNDLLAKLRKAGLLVD